MDIQLAGPYSVMRIYSYAQRMQFKCWESLLDTEMDGRLFEFSVRKAAALPTCVPLMQCLDRKLRGEVVLLESGQAENLLSMLTERQRAWAELADVAARLPPQYAALVCKSGWPSFLSSPLPFSLGGRASWR